MRVESDLCGSKKYNPEPGLYVLDSLKVRPPWRCWMIVWRSPYYWAWRDRYATRRRD